MTYIVETYGDIVDSVKYVQTFTNLRTKYDQYGFGGPKGGRGDDSDEESRRRCDSRLSCSSTSRLCFFLVYLTHSMSCVLVCRVVVEPYGVRRRADDDDQPDDSYFESVEAEDEEEQQQAQSSGGGGGSTNETPSSSSDHGDDDDNVVGPQPLLRVATPPSSGLASKSPVLSPPRGSPGRSPGRSPGLSPGRTSPGSPPLPSVSAEAAAVLDSSDDLLEKAAAVRRRAAAAAAADADEEGSGFTSMLRKLGGGKQHSSRARVAFAP